MTIKINSLIEDRLFSTTATSSLPIRDNIEEKYKWDLTQIYTDVSKWEEDFNFIESNLKVYKKFEGNLAASSRQLYECLQFDDNIGIKLDKLHLYAFLSKDSDLKNPLYQAMEDRVNNLFMKVSAAGSFIKPELLSIHEEKLFKILNEIEELKIYKHLFDDMVRSKAHTLSKDKEELLALAGELSLTPYNTYSMLTNAELKFPTVLDSNNNEIELSHGRFTAAIYSADRDFRQRSYKGYLTAFKNFANTFSVLFNGNLKANIFNAKARNYASAREASLDKSNIPLSVYDNLIKSANNNLESLHRWAALKKKLLKLDNLHPYDVYVTLFSSAKEKKYTYEDGRSIVTSALKILGSNYISDLETAFNNRWIDVCETQAKRSGAYSSGTTFGVHPYVLLNWSGLLNDVFTLAHEMGHNMHSYYTGKTQPFPYANYSIFLAEVASTFNESLLLDYLIENAASKEEKLSLLEKYLNNITATFYRQTMFAEFEMMSYEKTERGEALTSESLSKMFSDIYKKYWGKEMIVDEEESYTWSRIPHFYYNFYVYQYATGFAASEILAKKIKSGGKEALDRYMTFLRSGSSDYPINILKNAGVDMNSPEPIKATSDKMEQIINEIETII